MDPDLDALEAILRATGQRVERVRRRPLTVVGPADPIRRDIAAEFDHLRAVIDARFAVIRSQLALAADHHDRQHRIDWHGI